MDDLVRQCLLPGVVLIAICVMFFVIWERRLRSRLSRDSSTLALTPDSLRSHVQTSMNRAWARKQF